jgi:CheY-like chemotaxis protein
MKKRILVVEDTAENMETAKKFFEGLLSSDFEFVYCKNRQEADVNFKEAYAVITDRSIPYNDEQVSDAQKVQFCASVSYTEYRLPEINGVYLMFKAKTSGKPAVLISEHGDLQIGVQPLDLNGRSFLKRLLSVIDAKREKNCLFWSDYEYLSEFSKSWDSPIRINYDIGVGIKKTSTDAWRIAWEELQKQF